jgi:hypothetical protein
LLKQDNPSGSLGPPTAKEGFEYFLALAADYRPAALV